MAESIHQEFLVTTKKFPFFHSFLLKWPNLFIENLKSKTKTITLPFMECFHAFFYLNS